jgi:hypothetical protein
MKEEFHGLRKCPRQPRCWLVEAFVLIASTGKVYRHASFWWLHRLFAPRNGTKNEAAFTQLSLWIYSFVRVDAEMLPCKNGGGGVLEVKRKNAGEVSKAVF